jgi:hypothetical protein
LTRNVTSALSAGLLSFASFMLFVAPASAGSGLAILSGLGSFVVALESIFARPVVGFMASQFRSPMVRECDVY